VQQTFGAKPGRIVTYSAFSMYGKLSTLPSHQLQKVGEKKENIPKKV
jgi:hypothetical protein